MADLLVSAILPVLFERLTSPEFLQFLRREGLDSKIEDWQTTSSTIQEVLADAEEKQLTNRSVKKWLDELRELAYDADDLLDEFATEGLARELKKKQPDQASTSKVQKCVPLCFGNFTPRAIKLRIRMESEIKDVLDDVWSKNYNSWETLMSPFKAAAGGSKIIVTTHHSDVATTIGRCTQCYQLKFLSDEECWSLFKAHAFVNDDHPEIHLIRQKVIQYSKRLPLASKTLGGLLGSKQIDEWLKILNSKIWDLVKESDIPATLKLSYYYLPSHLKRCIAHCAILSEDYEFEEEELVFLWIAEGLIQRSEAKTEDLGHEYFDDLLSRSFFQRSNSNESKYVMHDLFRDLAKWVSGGTCSHLEDISEANKQQERLKKVRHLSYASGWCDGKCKFEVLSEAD